jgi:molybdopterin synthase catalytic subunit
MAVSTRSKPAIDVALLQGPLDLRQAMERLSSATGCGGEAIFVGRIRPERDPHLGELVAIEYDAYTTMAEQAVRTICEEVCTACGADAALALHSRGRVAVGEASVVVCVCARHRGPAFDACRQIMEELKSAAPIWKREIFENGARWQGAAPADTSGEGR